MHLKLVAGLPAVMKAILNCIWFVLQSDLPESLHILAKSDEFKSGSENAIRMQTESHCCRGGDEDAAEIIAETVLMGVT